MHGKNKGLLIRVFPNLDKYVQVIHVTYKNLDEITRQVKAIIDDTENAEKEEDISRLPPCPKYMNDGGDCPLMSQCHTDGMKGCR